MGKVNGAVGYCQQDPPQTDWDVFIEIECDNCPADNQYRSRKIYFNDNDITSEPNPSHNNYDPLSVGLQPIQTNNCNVYRQNPMIEDGTGHYKYSWYSNTTNSNTGGTFVNPVLGEDDFNGSDSYNSSTPPLSYQPHQVFGMM